MPDNLKLYTFAKVKSLSMQVQKEDIRGRILAVVRKQKKKKSDTQNTTRGRKEMGGGWVGAHINYFPPKNGLVRVRALLL